MGIKTTLSLEEANDLFDDYRFENIHPTHNGIIDTTYIVQSGDRRYILKKYEEAAATQIADELHLLEALKTCRFRTPVRLASTGGWHLYSLLEGKVVTTVHYSHIKSVARALAAMHHRTQGMHSSRPACYRPTLLSRLSRLKRENFAMYKRVSPLQHYRPGHDGLIHADLFRDNVLFDGDALGMIDFIDAGEGEFAFDLGVAALAWAVRGTSSGYLKLFLRSYNRCGPEKISYGTLSRAMVRAAHFYTLGRFHNQAGDHRHRMALLRTITMLKRGGIC